MNTQIIAIANQKGGVGKTTTCENLGVGLAQSGKKVLLIDGDPQGSLTISLGHPQPDKLPFTLSDAMGRILMDEPLRPGEGILHHPEGVDLMPADIQLSGMEVSLVNAMSRETILRQYLDTLKGQYSHMIIAFRNGMVLLVNTMPGKLRIPQFSDFKTGCKTKYLFRINTRKLFLAEGYKESDLDCKTIDWYSLEMVFTQFPEWTQFAVVTARHLSDWYYRNRYCGCCGSLMRAHYSERAMVCSECGDIV